MDVAGCVEICGTGRKEGRWLERNTFPAHWFARGTQYTKREWVSFYQWAFGLMRMTQKQNVIRFIGLTNPVMLIVGSGRTVSERKVSLCVGRQ